MKKVLFVIPSLNGGGAERFVSILSSHLASKGYNVRVLMFEEMTPFYKLDERITLKSIGYRINRTSRMQSVIQIAWNVLCRSVIAVKREIQDFSPDIVIPFLPQADIAVYLASKTKRSYKIICSERNDPHERSFVTQTILKKIYKHADALVCQSETVATYYSQIPKEKKQVIGNPVDPLLIPEVCPESDALKIVSAGRLDFQKNFSLLINSFADCINLIPQDTNLIIYGEGREREQLAKLAKDRGVASRVFLPGQNKNLLSSIKDASLFVMSSDFEGFPNALLEAIVVGLPVISTDFPTGTARTLIGKQNGLIVPVGDQKELSNAIVTLMNNKEQRTEMRAANRTMLGTYSIEEISHKWEFLFS